MDPNFPHSLLLLPTTLHPHERINKQLLNIFCKLSQTCYQKNYDWKNRKILTTHELWPPWIKLTAQYGSILFKKGNQWITNYLNKRYVSCKKFTGQRMCCMLLLTLKHFILFKRSKIIKINFSVNKEIMVNMVSIINTILIHFISVRKNVLIFLKTIFLVIGFVKL